MKKYLLTFIFLLYVTCFIVHINVYAVTEATGDLQVTYDKPMFPDTTVWYPGLTIAKSFSVKNLGEKTHTVSLKAENASQTGNLGDNLYFRVDEGAANRYGGANDRTMKNFWDNGETNLSDIGSGNITSYTVTIYMPATLGNEFQGKKAQFDLVVGFVGTDSKIIISNTATVTGITIAQTASLITTTLIPKITPDILGATTQSATLKPTGEIKGEKTQNKKQINWFIVFLIILCLIIIYRIITQVKRIKGE